MPVTSLRTWTARLKSRFACHRRSIPHSRFHSCRPRSWSFETVSNWWRTRSKQNSTYSPPSSRMKMPCERRGQPRIIPFRSASSADPERTDSLRILPGPVAGKALIAAPWTPGRDLAVAHEVLPQFVWAALDCPGGLAWLDVAAGQSFVLGRLAVKLVSPVVVGEPYVALGWQVGRDGRKLFSRTALLHASGRVCGVGAATWFLMQN